MLTIAVMNISKVVVHQFIVFRNWVFHPFLFHSDHRSILDHRPSSCSDAGPLVDLSRGVFPFRLKIFLFSKYSPP